MELDHSATIEYLALQVTPSGKIVGMDAIAKRQRLHWSTWAVIVARNPCSLNSLHTHTRRYAFPLLAAVLASFAAAAAARPPNVVLIVSDDQAWTDYGFMGHADIRTPRLDQLAAEGALFTRGYVPSSLCRPSLAALITGLYAHRHKITGNDPPPGVDRGEMLRHIRAVPTLPRLLAERGYRSFQAGKWWEGSYEQGGFTHGMSHGDTARGGRHGDLGLRIGREGLLPIFDFLDDCGETPFFLWYAPMLPHSPHDPPQRLLEKYAVAGRSPHVARYYAMCEWFDETCGELLDGLESRGLAGDTLVVYVTDNGWIQDPESRDFAPRSKRSPYEGGVRTPIVLRWPGHIAPRRDERTPVSSIDLAPTILAACGCRPAAEMPGVDLLDAMNPAGTRNAVFGEIFTHDAVDLDSPAANLLFRWCVVGDWKLIVPHDADRPAELFHVSDDPAEADDLADERPEVVQELRTALDLWWTPE